MNFLRRLTTIISLLAESRQTKEFLRVLKSSKVRYGQRLLGDFEAGELEEILDSILKIVPEHQQKLARYYVHQVALGHLPLHRLNEDAVRINQTIDNFRTVSQRREWTQSRNLFDFPDWRKLENELLKYREDFGRDHYKDEEHSKILLSKQYVNQNAVLLASLLGGEPTEAPWVQYWLRKITTATGCWKYGRGTQWCTNTDPAAFADQSQHPFHIYKLLYIIEKATNDTPRRPIAQFSPGVIMGKHDTEVAKAKGYLRDFLAEAITTVPAADPEFAQVVPVLKTLL